ncbi:P-loop NTPase fold protein [Lacrimispora algidixylanolytica]|uniref:KAP NTPase domain-containing protein n=1 Tax=Lacrimispora algidixylanolytica TaxID=94868 RepID=A0A419T4C6_9FIRM|nr:P-loop NTPase fold protein [Lacrimispora algidixylanolytica]RKD32407.1 hypothetical protein BET01_03440 [Lacrimispora algidixylanolytica]
MDKNIIEILNLEKCFGIYFSNRLQILICICILGIGIMGGLYVEKRIDLTRFNKIAKKNLAFIFFIITMGMVLQFSGLEISFTINYMPAFVFCLVSVIIVASYIVESVLYVNSKEESVGRVFLYFHSLILAEVFLLMLMNRLDGIEMIAAVILAITFNCISEWIKGIAEGKEKAAAGKCGQRKDVPIMDEADLFSRRKTQLKSFCHTVEAIGNDSFAVMISGVWGSGKSSFINVFEKKIQNAEFVWVEGGFKAKPRKMLEDIAKQIEDIFEKNRICIKRNIFIRSYFNKAADMIEGTGNEFAANLIRTIFEDNESGYKEKKDLLNQKLEVFYGLTKKKIYIIVDNLDRLNPKEREKIFEVIRECVCLKNCVTIFLVDYKAFQTKYLNKNFIEKYINYHIELYALSFQEIYIDISNSFLNDDFKLGKNLDFCNLIDEMKNKFLNYYQNINKRIESDLENNINNLHVDNISKESELEINKRIRKLQATVSQVHQRTGNPRKIRRFMQDIENVLTVVFHNWFSNPEYQKNEFTKGNWTVDIFEISFLKCFLNEEYEKLVNTGNFQIYEMVKENDITSVVLSNYSMDSNEIEKGLLDLLVFKLYAIDLTFDKSRHQIIINDLEKKDLKENYLIDYIQEGISFTKNLNYYEVVLEYLKKNQFRDNRNRVEAIKALISNVTMAPIIHDTNLESVHHEIKKIISETVENKKILDKDLLFIKNEVQSIEKQAIFYGYANLKSVLKLMFKDIDNYFPEYVYSVDTYSDNILKLLYKYPLEGFVKGNSNAETLINFISMVKKEFCQPQYFDIKEVVFHILDQALYSYNILRIWEEKKVLESFDRGYFNLTNLSIERETWSSKDSWNIACDYLDKLIDNNIEKEAIPTLVTEFMFQTERRVLEADPLFDNIEIEVAKKMNALFFHVEQKIPDVREKQGDNWLWNTIRIYKIKEYAKERLK